jgi:hypothetical protein
MLFLNKIYHVYVQHTPENVSWLRRFALSLLKKESSLKASIRHKRFKALMDNNYLLTVLLAK